MKRYLNSLSALLIIATSLFVSCSSDDEIDGDNNGSVTIHYSESDYKGVYYSFEATYSDYDEDGVVFITSLDEDKDAFIGNTHFEFSTDEALCDLQESVKISIDEDNVTFYDFNGDEDDVVYNQKDVSGSIVLKKKTSNSVTLKFQDFNFRRNSDNQKVTINGNITYKLDE